MDSTSQKTSRTLPRVTSNATLVDEVLQFHPAPCSVRMAALSHKFAHTCTCNSKRPFLLYLDVRRWLVIPTRMIRDGWRPAVV